MEPGGPFVSSYGATGVKRLQVSSAFRSVQRPFKPQHGLKEEDEKMNRGDGKSPFGSPAFLSSGQRVLHSSSHKGRLRPAGPVAVCGRGATGGLTGEPWSWLPGRPPSLEASEGGRDEGLMMLTEGRVGEEVWWWLLGGGEVMVGVL
ncbi:hypothetical protein EYF80_019343 [Liparis tanakae]|uniref:Uncharacterized protein n=1 Tax=Liparis tanakae TaxID=230148 RepID=A0A4Z2HX77_9TELE|nr:hypothetical protein EYF80_019343 [Liparis tanakae]